MMSALALSAPALAAVASSSCATGALVDVDSPFIQGDREGNQPASQRGDASSSEGNAGEDGGGAPETEGGSDAAPNDAASSSGSKVTCAGHDYPAVVTTSIGSCVSALSGCTGAHEFRVVGCFTNAPPANPCPPGFKVAANMLIGLWAQAASLTRTDGPEGLVCMFTGSAASGATMSSACGLDSAPFAYCWKSGTGCDCPDFPACGTTCCYQACHQDVPVCTTSGYAAPVLCVK